MPSAFARASRAGDRGVARHHGSIAAFDALTGMKEATSSNLVMLTTRGKARGNTSGLIATLFVRFGFG